MYHQKSHQQQLAIEQRVQRFEDVLTSLDHDVRDRLGIKSSPATSLSSRPDFAEAPAAPEGAAPEAQRADSQGSVPTNVGR